MFTPHGLGQLQRVPIPRSGRSPWPSLFDAVLLVPDGTLVVDVPCTGHPALVEPGSGAGEALDRFDTWQWLRDEPERGRLPGATARQVAVARNGLDRFLADGDCSLEEELCASR